MAYPPLDNPENQLKDYPILETIPQAMKDNPRRIVHFDFDPKNSKLVLNSLANNTRCRRQTLTANMCIVFVSSAYGGPDEHAITPVLKVSYYPYC